MNRADLEYDLPEDLVAQFPAESRDASRLMVVNRRSRRISDACFRDLAQWLPAGSLLVLNDARVVPAALSLRRATGGRVEGLFVAERERGKWEVMLTRSSRLRPGVVLQDEKAAYRLTIETRIERGRWVVAVDPPDPAIEVLDRIGYTPLPPYINRTTDRNPQRETEDRRRYQTLYADRDGAVAAPTAGLHFTDRVFAVLRERNIETACLTLFVGPGTFAPIESDRLEDHHMEAERYDLPADTTDAINRARAEGRPVVAVGTTTVRTLESCVDPGGRVRPGSGATSLFIYPPFRFRVVDALITNFHLPGSTLIALVGAFAGQELIRDAYRQAIRERYRFYSFGDAMLIL